MSEPRVTFERISYKEVLFWVGWTDEDDCFHEEWSAGKNLEECKAKIRTRLDKRQQGINKLLSAVEAYKPEKEVTS